MSFSDIGNLIYLPFDEIEPGKPTEAHEYLIRSAANHLESIGRNWVPVIVKETAPDQYQVIGNSFVYAVADAAGLSKVWCIVAEDTPETVATTQILAQEIFPKTNLSTASREEISAALDYIRSQPNSPITSKTSTSLLSRLDEASRQYWKSFDPIKKMGCGITTDLKLKAFEKVFYLTPELRPKTNLSTASREEISAAVDYVLNQLAMPLKGVSQASLVDCLDEAPRQYWENFDPVKKLGCGITTKAKLKALEEVFYLTPEPMPEVITDRKILETLTTQQLKDMAKKRDVKGLSKLKKADLVELLAAA